MTAAQPAGLLDFKKARAELEETYNTEHNRSISLERGRMRWWPL